MKLSILCLLVACVVAALMVQETSSWPRIRLRRIRWRRVWRAAKPFVRRYVPFLKKRTQTTQDDEIFPAPCDFECFWGMQGDPQEGDLNAAMDVFRAMDKDGNGSISKDEFDAFNLTLQEAEEGSTTDPADEGGEGTKRELMNEGTKRELMNELGELLNREVNEE